MPPTATPPDHGVLWARGLHHAYGPSPALSGVSLGVREGEVLSVTGPRGCGKSTLLRCLSGELAPQQGEVWFDGAPLHRLRRGARERLRRQRTGWVGSAPQLVPDLSVWENTALPLLLSGTGHQAAHATAREWLERLDIGRCARERPAALTRAQQQRAVIARALVHSPTVLFADEPTAPLLHHADRAQVLRTLTNAARSHHFTVVLATHDPAATAQREAAGTALADRTVRITDGQADGEPETTAEDHMHPENRAPAERGETARQTVTLTKSAPPQQSGPADSTAPPAGAEQTAADAGRDAAGHPAVAPGPQLPDAARELAAADRYPPGPAADAAPAATEAGDGAVGDSGSSHVADTATDAEGVPAMTAASADGPEQEEDRARCSASA